MLFRSECRRTEKRVHERVEKDVAVGVANEARVVRDVRPAEHQPAAGGETVNIVADSRPHAVAAGIATLPVRTSSRA